ncbi:MAG TPA: hypothetical protein DHW82_11560, partial [Spirochaetia bacterium]|nr:hypothetical protein [Spirochaetia bacterium]
MEFVKLTALHIADSINLKKFKSEYTGSLINSSSSELYYRVEENQYLFLLNYGVVVFSNFSDIDMTRTIALIADYSQGVFENKIREDYQIALNEGKKNEFGYQTLLVSEITENLIKVVSINLAESVALDFYFQVSETILNEVKYFTEEMEKKGKVKISKHNMLKFIGKTLNTKNRIIENLYIFDVPEM